MFTKANNKMMTTNEKLILEFKDEKAKAINEQRDFNIKAGLAYERAMAFDLACTKAELLFDKEMKEDVLPQLDKADCYTPLPHDLKLLEKLWYNRNPAHENNADSGVDMFWGTVACVIDDYIAAVRGNGV